jgi:ABC-type multidrug transport system fused ATPase/permease subunit
VSGLASSIVAIIGTLAGAAITHLFGERSRERERKNKISEASRQERLASYIEFVAVVHEFRRLQRDRWHRRIDSSEEVAEQARHNAYRHRALGRSALARIELTARKGVDERVVEAARKALEETEKMRAAGSQGDLEAQGDVARQTLDDFVGIASRSVSVPDP